VRPTSQPLVRHDAKGTFLARVRVRPGLRSDPTETGESHPIDSGLGKHAGCMMAAPDGWGLQQIRCRSDSLSIVRKLSDSPEISYKKGGQYFLIGAKGDAIYNLQHLFPTTGSAATGASAAIALWLRRTLFDASCSDIAPDLLCVVRADLTLMLSCPHRR
jgi:hypothetical protein